MTGGVRGLGACLLVLAQCAVSMAVCAQSAPIAAASTQEDPRLALLAEQANQAQQLDVLEKTCYAKFFTTNCLLDVARQRRSMVAEFQRKTTALDAADRQQRAQEARQRVQEKQQEQARRQQAIDPVAAEQAQQDKQAEIDAKQQAHADKAAAASQSAPARESKTGSGPSAAERAANQAAFDKKQAEIKQRLLEREAQRAKAAASAASAPRALPLPAAVGQ